MKFTETEAVLMCCQNCGHKVVGYKSRDQTARFQCERCGTVWVSKLMDKRTIDTRSTAPLGQVAIFGKN